MSEPFIRLPISILQSDAYIYGLSPSAKQVLHGMLYVSDLVAYKSNGKADCFSFSYGIYLEMFGWHSRASFYRGVDEVLDVGFFDCVKNESGGVAMYAPSARWQQWQPLTDAEKIDISHKREEVTAHKTDILIWHERYQNDNALGSKRYQNDNGSVIKLRLKRYQNDNALGSKRYQNDNASGGSYRYIDINRSHIDKADGARCDTSLKEKDSKPPKTETSLEAIIPDQEQRARFESFFEAYPKKSGKFDAARWWAAANPSEETTQQIIDSVQANKKHNRQWKETKYVPVPARYLESGDWTHDTTPQPKEQPPRFKVIEYPQHHEQPPAQTKPKMSYKDTVKRSISTIPTTVAIAYDDEQAIQQRKLEMLQQLEAFKKRNGTNFGDA